MANDVVNKKKLRKIKIIVVVVLIIGFILYCCLCGKGKNPLEVATSIFHTLQGESQSETQSESEVQANSQVNSQANSQSQSQQSGQNSQVITNVDGEMQVHFIDVGQADATLIIQNEKTMLFDVATRSRGDDVAQYIKNLGINYVDVLVLSHPHDDHMGGAADFLENMDVGIIYAPDFFEENLTSGWYKNMLEQIDIIDAKRNEGVAESKQTSILQFPKNEKGEFVKFNLGDAYVEFLAPFENKYSDLNDYSICCKVTYGTVDIMFTGDATKSVEEDLLNQNTNLDVEIFQAGHHGSDTSNSKAFIEAMSPEAIVISCGMKNKHNHPVKSVIEMFKNMKIPVYRTDEVGDIVMVTDGTTYSFDKEKGSYTSGEEHKGE